MYKLVILAQCFITRTFDSLTLGEVIVLVLSEQTSLVTPHDAFKKSSVHLYGSSSYISGVLTNTSQTKQPWTYVEEKSLHGRPAQCCGSPADASLRSHAALEGVSHGNTQYSHAQTAALR